MNRSVRGLGLFVWTVVLLAVLWVGFGQRLLTRWAYAVERGRLQAATEELADVQDIASLQVVSKAFHMVARVARPGVVNIAVRGGTQLVFSARELERLHAIMGDMLTEDQWAELRSRRGPRPPGSASGILFDADGHILTNYHVVEDRTRIVAQLHDERTFEARLIGTDPKTDLAVIKINAPELQPLAFANAQKVEVGDWVVAVGAPFGLTQTVTHGIVSATGRTRIAEIDIDYENFIQTDAAINPGNSGGPLLNLRGEVVGVNTAIATNGEAFNAGVAFAIPSDMAVKVAKELIGKGKVARGWLGLGLSLEPLTDDDREVLTLPTTQGVLIERVLKDSPAEKAGMQPEDVIVAVNGEPVRDSDYFRSVVADLGPNQAVTLRVIRDGREQEVQAQLGLQPESTRALREPEPREISDLGLRGFSFRSGLRSTYPLARVYDETERGVLVTQIDADAKQTPRIKPGEMIVACDGQEVKSVGELLAALKAAPQKESFRLQVLEPGGDRRIVNFKRR
jgi:serine protease Do